MTDVAGLTLLLTRRCNARCAHCGFASGPASRGDMSTERATAFIAAAQEAVGIRSVALSGGEPMLVRERVLEVLTFAARRGLESELVTNSFWARSAEEATAWLSLLRDKGGLVTLVTSCDAFHTRFVPVERIRTAVRAALDVGLRVSVKAVGEEPPQSLRLLVARALGLEPETRGLRIDTGSPVPVGRAAQLTAGSAGDCAGRCDWVIRYASVDAEGDLHACCGFGGRARLVARVNERTLGPALRAMRGDLLLNLLGSTGPAGVWDLAGLGPLPDFRNACDLCNHLYLDPKASAAVGRLLQALVLTPPGRSPSRERLSAAARRAVPRTGSDRRPG